MRPVTPSNNAAVSPAGSGLGDNPKVTPPLLAPSFPFGVASAAVVLPACSPKRQYPTGPSARTSAEKASLAILVSPSESTIQRQIQLPRPRQRRKRGNP